MIVIWLYHMRVNQLAYLSAGQKTPRDWLRGKAWHILPSSSKLNSTSPWNLYINHYMHTPQLRIHIGVEIGEERGVQLRIRHPSWPLECNVASPILHDVEVERKAVPLSPFDAANKYLWSVGLQSQIQNNVRRMVLSHCLSVRCCLVHRVTGCVPKHLPNNLEWIGTRNQSARIYLAPLFLAALYPRKSPCPLRASYQGKSCSECQQDVS